MTLLHRSFMTALIAIFMVFALQVNGAVQTKLPDTAAGKKLAQLLAVIESGDIQKMRKFAEDFSKSFLDQFSIEDHVDFFKQAYDRYGGFEVVRVDVLSDYEIAALLKCKNSAGYRQIELITESKSPYAVKDMSYGMAEPPGKEEPSDIKALSPPTASEAADPNAVVKGKLGMEIDMYLLGKIKEGFSGTVLVAKKGEKVLHKGYGWAVREQRIPIITQTVFDIGSISKPFTATVIMRLEQQGKLEVKNPITKFFDNVPEDKKGITIHHLLTHSSGLGDYHDTKGDFEKMTRDEALQHIFNQELKFIPGEKNAYSNSGYTLLAIIAEKVSGRSFKEYLKQEIFDPAGMSSTGFYRNPAWKEKNVAHGYEARKFGKQNSPLTWPEITWALLGNGGMVSTAEDLYKFHLAMKGNKILSRKAKKKSYTMHVNEGDGYWMGYGWGIRKTDRNTKIVSHGGANDFGFLANFVRYLDEDVVIIITSNSGRRAKVRELYSKLTSIIFNNK
ncbi:MAG: beta-lactamase family protein [Candidatus Aminicenantes bacterium]|nr:beta-lactamase family protein [Candidatus Aminicenantes bacterium]